MTDDLGGWVGGWVGGWMDLNEMCFGLYGWVGGCVGGWVCGWEGLRTYDAFFYGRRRRGGCVLEEL